MDLLAYADKVNPLVLTNGTLDMEHKELYQKLNQAREALVNTHKLKWNLSKESSMNFSSWPVMSTTTLDIVIHSSLLAQLLMDLRTQKATSSL